jgi:deoxyribonuclease-4
MPFLGAHMSIAGHPHKALLRGKEVGCQVIQIFTRNRLRWSAKRLSKEEINSFFKTKIDTNIIPVAIHGSYLINLASPSTNKRNNSLNLLVKEMAWAERLKIPFLVIHPGSHMGEGELRGLNLVGEMINRANEKTPEYKVQILLELTSGQGTSLGYRFEHIREILGLSWYHERLGVCFDTCHAFTAGYDFRTKESYRHLLKEFDNIIGLKYLKLFHINDSKNDLGSRIDRHDHPGKGFIGREPFSFFLNDARFTESSFLLETPKGYDTNGVDWDIVNLKLLKSMIRNKNRDDRI